MRLFLFLSIFLPTLSIAQGLFYENLVIDENGLGPVTLGMDLSSASEVLGIDIKTNSYHYGDDECSSYAFGKSIDDWDIRFITVERKIGKIDIFSEQVRTSRGLGVGSPGTAITEAYAGDYSLLPAHDAYESTVQVKTTAGTILEFTGQRSRRAGDSIHAIKPPDRIRYYSISLPGVGSSEGCL